MRAHFVFLELPFRPVRISSPAGIPGRFQNVFLTSCGRCVSFLTHMILVSEQLRVMRGSIQLSFCRTGGE